MADTATAPRTGDASVDQVTQLKNYLSSIMAKQEELKETIAKKHEKAVAARTTLRRHTGAASLRNIMVDMEDENTHQHTVTSVETPGMEQRLENYACNVEELEKELEETTKLVNEVATALAVISAQSSS